MKRAGAASIFNADEFQKRFFVLSVTEGTIRFVKDEQTAQKNLKAGKLFSFTDINSIQGDYSNGGKTVDFSGERNYPFPFKIELNQRMLVLASKTREERILWVNGFMVLYEAKLIKNQIAST